MKRAACLAISLGLAACAGPAAKENFFTLSAPAAAVSGTSPSVHVGAVSVPEAVDRSAMVIRTGPNRVEIDDSNRWAESLKSAIPRVLAENLRRELGTARVSSARQGAAVQIGRAHV